MALPSRVLVVLMSAVVLAGCSSVQTFAQDRLVSSYTAEDGRQILAAILSHPDIKAVADQVAPLVVRAEVTVVTLTEVGNGWDIEIERSVRVDRYDYRYQDGRVTNTTASKPDFTLKTSQSITLDVINADDGLRVFACALKDNAVTLEATNPIHGASFNAAKDRIIGSANDCVANAGDAVTWKGQSGVLFEQNHTLGRFVARMGNESGDYLAFDKYRAPFMWYPASSDLCRDRDCTGAGYSAMSRDMNACAAEVEKAYSKDVATDAWKSGIEVSKALKKSAELAACKLVFGGSS